MAEIKSREIRLASRPKGAPELAQFDLTSTVVPEPAEGQVLVRNRFISVDPYMRGRMNDVRSYVPPFALGAPLEGGAVGEVVASKAPGITPGAVVLSNKGWREAFLATPEELRVLEKPMRPLSLYLGVLGMPGMTAWVGLDLIGQKAGDRVFVSAAAGAVGSLAGQLAKIRGAYVVGSAGSDEKVAMLTRDFGFDAGINYKTGDLRESLARAAPEGIDVYFDNVGGDHLEAALAAMRPSGRVVLCGAISKYNDAEPTPGPRNLGLVIGKRLTLKGFIVSDSMNRMPEFLREVAPLVASGRIRAPETVVEGIEKAPQAFLDLLGGGNVGKMIVKLS